MGEQVVPWAERRRALVRCPFRGRWLEAVGRVADGEEVWETYTLDDDGEPISDVWVSDGAPTALLPGQHPCCFEDGPHAPDCERGKRIETNLARGVPAFWAEWAMWALPSGDPGTCAVFELRSYEDGTPRVIGVLRRDWRGLGEWGGGEFSCAPDGCASTSPLIALGPDGPTLAPWGLG